MAVKPALWLEGKNATIGGLSSSATNVVSGNGTHGIQIANDSNMVQGNIVGMDKNGTVVLANGSNGIRVDAGINNVVGGTAAGSRNVITGNGNNGVELRPRATPARR